MIIYKRNFDENRYIYFFLKQENVFINYMEIFEKVGKIIKKNFNNELVFSKKYLKPKKINKN